MNTCKDCAKFYPYQRPEGCTQTGGCKREYREKGALAYHCTVWEDACCPSFEKRRDKLDERAEEMWDAVWNIKWNVERTKREMRSLLERWAAEDKEEKRG